MDELRVACASGPAYAPHTAAMLHSVLEHANGMAVRVHYLVDRSFPARSAQRIEETVRAGGGAIEFHTVAEERIAGLPSAALMHPAVWYPMLLPELLPDVERVLYLDGDVVALDDLRPLWATDLGDAYAGAVPNVWEPWNAGIPAQLGLAGPEEYLNSGVLLLGLERWRRDGLTEAMLAHARSAERISMLDQDTLSAVLAGDWLRLHPRWNCMNSIMLFDWAADLLGPESVAEARRRPGLRHFEGRGPNKPWHLLCERPHRDEYLRHRRATPWTRVRPAGLTPANLIRRVTRSAA